MEDQASLADRDVRRTLNAAVLTLLVPQPIQVQPHVLVYKGLWGLYSFIAPAYIFEVGSLAELMDSARLAVSP